MPRAALRDTHLLLDNATYGRLRDISAWSDELVGMGKAVRAIVRKFHGLMNRQLLAEQSGRTLYLVEVGPDGAELPREKLDLKL